MFLECRLRLKFALAPRTRQEEILVVVHPRFVRIQERLLLRSVSAVRVLADEEGEGVRVYVPPEGSEGFSSPVTVRVDSAGEGVKREEGR